MHFTDPIAIIAYSISFALFAIKSSTWSNFVVNRFRHVRIAPFGPNPYLLCAFSLFSPPCASSALSLTLA